MTARKVTLFTKFEKLKVNSLQPRHTNPCFNEEEKDTNKVLIFKWEGFELKKITHKQFDNKEIEVFAIKLNTRIDSL